MKELKEILFGVNIDSVYGDTNLSISGISFDSRQIKQNNIFIAIKGYDLDGHNYIDQSINNGASVVVCEKLPKKINEYEIVFIKVKCSKTALYTISSNFYGNPSSKIDLIGVTGTNGKTTITSLLYKLFNNQGIKSGLISTISIEYEEFTENSKNTTPDPVLLNHHLSHIL